MILLTVGTQLPFDRFVRIVDETAPLLATPVFAQIGHGDYKPRNMDWRPFVRPVEFDEMLARTTLIVSHAGVGTVVMAQKHSKPVILFPRRAALAEHRNDHQLATVDSLEGRSGIYIARTAEELRAMLARELAPPVIEAMNLGRDRLRDAIADFIRAGG